MVHSSFCSPVVFFRGLFAGSIIRQRMPGELLPTMAAPSVSKSKLSRAKADLYLIVSRLIPAHILKADKLLVRRRYNL